MLGSYAITGQFDNGVTLTMGCLRQTKKLYYIPLKALIHTPTTHIHMTTKLWSKFILFSLFSPSLFWSKNLHILTYTKIPETIFFCVVWSRNYFFLSWKELKKKVLRFFRLIRNKIWFIHQWNRKVFTNEWKRAKKNDHIKNNIK